MATDCCVVWLRGRSAVAVGRGVACRWVRRCGVAWRGLGVALRMPCGAMWCGVVFRGGGVLELVIGFLVFTYSCTGIRVHRLFGSKRTRCCFTMLILSGFVQKAEGTALHKCSVILLG